MSQFSKQIPTEQGARTFYFNQLPEMEPETWHVSVVNRYNKVKTIIMEQVGGKWAVANQETEQWIISLEKVLSNAILEHTTAAIMNKAREV